MFERAKIYVPTVILGFLIFYFAFHALTGERGLLSANQRQVRFEMRVAELAQLQTERAELQARVRLLDSRSLSADLLEERARSLLGFAGPNEYVIRMPVPAG
jgi:cell division protein FtsB